MVSFSERLVIERKRLGFTQDAMAAIGGVQKQAQSKYENGKNHPNTLYLEAIAKAGVDLAYLMTGDRRPVSKDSIADEELLIDAYRSLTVEKRKVMLASLLTGEVSPAAKIVNKGKFEGTQINADGGRFTVNGDYHEKN